jgi:hypothetical protein
MFLSAFVSLYVCSFVNLIFVSASIRFLPVTFFVL